MKPTHKLLERIKKIVSIKSSSASRCGLFFFLMLTLVLGTVELVLKCRYYGVLPTVIAIVAFYLICGLIAGILALLFQWLRKIRWQSFFTIVFGLLMCIITVYLELYIMLVGFSGMLFVYLLSQTIRKKYANLSGWRKAVRYTFLVLSGSLMLLMIVFIILPGGRMTELPKQAQLSLPNAEAVTSTLENPSEKGTYSFEEYYYGIADQKIDPYPGQEILPSKSVDASMLLEMDAQQQAAKVMVGAFLRASLQGETEYYSLFSEFAGGAQWLPKTALSAQMNIECVLRAYDQNGREQVLPIDTFGGIQEPIEAMIYKQPLSLLMDTEEPVLQQIVIPFAAFDMSWRERLKEWNGNSHQPGGRMRNVFWWMIFD